MTSDGVPINTRAPLDKMSPAKAMAIPLIKASVMEVCTVSDISLDFPVAKKRAASTLLPREMPIKRLIKTLIKAVVEPTAAKAWLPLYLPTTIMSTALNISCKMPESIKGSEKDISLSMSDPLHMSISYLLFFIEKHLLRQLCCILDAVCTGAEHFSGSDAF